MIGLKVSYETVREGKEYIRKVVDKNVIRNIHSAKISGTLNLPYKEIAVDLDKRWNAKKINAEMLQAIEKGESIKEMSERLQRVTDMDKVSAIRNARTMTTAFENQGRLDGMKALQKEGGIIKKRWLATHDSKTRDAHTQLDGVEIDIDEPFVNDVGPIMYPGDPSASAENVYNCRCTLEYEEYGFEPTLPKGTIRVVNDEAKKNGLTYGKYWTPPPEMDKQIYIDMLEFERKYINDNKEHYKLMNNYGEFLFGNMTGDVDSARIPQEIIDQVLYLSHTHPRETGYLGGTFSEGDILTFARNERMQTMRAAAKEGIYTITKGQGFDGAEFNKFVSTAYKTKINSEDINTLAVEAHKLLLKNQKKYDYIYSLEKWR